MKKILLILCAAGCIAAAQTTVPKGATQVTPGTYRYTDAHGAKWIYRVTPFGVARMRDEVKPAAETKPTPFGTVSAAAQQNADAARPEAPPPAPLKATDAGNSVSFERVTPFGVEKWQTLKTDLDSTEQAAWDRQRARDAK
ncbi:MAG TPA: hypothetical protein VN736_16790 [Candidatus Limnocylindrales bacterium]|nr:hypothetical protein [Candidatus Limnocylindrales bacterium]